MLTLYRILIGIGLLSGWSLLTIVLGWIYAQIFRREMWTNYFWGNIQDWWVYGLVSQALLILMAAGLAFCYGVGTLIL